jgi:AcrR family transcriptional regulator
VEAAKEVFEEDGFLEARISDISERAGLSHGSFYHYFDSKEQIFREVAIEITDLLNAPLNAVIFDLRSTVTTRERVRAGVRRYLRSYRDEARIIGVIEQVSRYDQHLNAVRHERQRGSLEQLVHSIRQMQFRGQADPRLDPVVVAQALGAMVSRFAEMWFVQKLIDCDFEDGVEQTTRLFTNAMRLSDESARPEIVP